MNNLGNIIESILGGREHSVSVQQYLHNDRAVMGVCTRLSRFLSAVCQFTNCTGTTDMPVLEWLDYVDDLTRALRPCSDEWQLMHC